MTSIKTESNPKVSVVMCVLNGEKYLHQCIDSILNQTFSDFEFIIVNDGSSDSTAAILEAYAAQDERVKILENSKNMGIGYSRNKGNDAARGEYIAIMDADDWSSQERLTIQEQFLNDHSDIAVLGTARWTNWKNGSDYQVEYNPSLPGFLRWALLFGCEISNPTVMMRRRLFSEEGFRYEESRSPAEDYELWTRISLTYKLSNLKEPLLYYRWHESNTSIVMSASQREKEDSIIRRQLKSYTGEEMPEGLMRAYKKPEKVQNLSEAQTIIHLYLLLLQTTKAWHLNSKESIAIMEDFLRRLDAAATQLSKPRLVLINTNERHIFIRYYLQYIWYTIVDLLARRFRKLLHGVRITSPE